MAGSLLVGPARQLRQGALPRAVLLHALRAHGADPRHPTDRALRPRHDRAAARCWPRLVVGGAGRASAPLLPAYPLTLAHPGAHRRHPGHEPRRAAGLHRPLVARPRGLLRRRRLRGGDHGHREAGRASSACLVVGVLLAAGTAAVFGLLAIRATGTYFLMITLALGMVIWGLAFRWVSLTKGDNGIAGVPRPVARAALEPERRRCPSSTSAWSSATVAWALMGLLVVSPFGLGLRGHPRERDAHAGARLQRVAAQVRWPSSSRARSRASAARSGPTTTASSARTTCSSSPRWRPS